MYKLPVSLKDDIKRFGALAGEYRDKKIKAVQFKAFRVPMGVYEQRQDDVYMARVRTTGGVIYPKQFLDLIEIAQKHHSNLLHITTRQELQVQNLDLNNIEPLLNELQKTGLATKGGGGNTTRNIIVSEESGIAQQEVFDATPYAMALTTKLIAEPDSYLLPRKLKIAFSSDDRQIDYAGINDVGFVAKLKDGERGFQVYVGGGGGSKPAVGRVLFDFVPASELYAVAEAVKKFFSEHGNRKNRHKARLRYIFYKLGDDETFRLLKEYFQTAKENVQPFVLNDITENERPQYVFQPSGNTAQEQDFELWKKRYVQPQKQQGYNSVSVPFQLGNIHLDDEKTVTGIQTLLRFIDRFGKHTIRFSAAQNIRLRNIPDEALDDLFLILKAFVAEIALPVFLNSIVACTGADTCRLGIGLSKGLAKAIRSELAKSALDLDKFADVRLNISGCPNSCGQQLWADIGFSGKVLRNDRAYPAYQVYLAANRSDAPKLADPVGNINARDIPKFVYRLLENYLQTEAKYLDFRAWLQTDGRRFAVEMIEEYKNIPPFSEDKNYYFDWSAEIIFSAVCHGIPECTAGLFDMIDVDIAQIKNSKAALETESEKAKINGFLYDIIYSSSRMLLVTRGLEPKTTHEIFDFFKIFFIEQGIVEERFKNIVSIARDNKEYDFILHREEIYALSDSVIELYENMDDSLQFKNIVQKEAPEPKKTATQTEPEKIEKNARKFKDLRGTLCPMNFVQTKIQLASMHSGEELEIWLDDGQPINNVPGSVHSEGHSVLEQTRIKDYWKVVIRKNRSIWQK